jgi:hypothetical protein
MPRENSILPEGIIVEEFPPRDPSAPKGSPANPITASDFAPEHPVWRKKPIASPRRMARRNRSTAKRRPDRCWRSDSGVDSSSRKRYFGAAGYGPRERFIITAAHCLPRLPRAGLFEARELTFRNVLGELGRLRRPVTAECLFGRPCVRPCSV